MATDVTNGSRFVWHECVTTDPDRAQAFYGELLGWEFEVWKPGEMDYRMISVGGATHGGFGRPQGGVPPHWLSHVLVEDLDAALGRVSAAGGTAVAGPFDIPEVGRMCIVADPQGAALSVYQPAGEPPSAEGVFLWDELLTEDVEAAKSFYGAVLGWTAADMDMGEMGTYVLFLGAGDANVAGLMERPEGVPVNAWMTYAAAPDIDARVARVPELGGTVQMPPMDVPGVGRFAVITDPTGATVGLYEPQG